MMVTIGATMISTTSPSPFLLLFRVSPVAFALSASASRPKHRGLLRGWLPSPLALEAPAAPLHSISIPSSPPRPRLKTRRPQFILFQPMFRIRLEIAPLLSPGEMRHQPPSHLKRLPRWQVSKSKLALLLLIAPQALRLLDPPLKLDPRRCTGAWRRTASPQARHSRPQIRPLRSPVNDRRRLWMSPIAW